MRPLCLAIPMAILSAVPAGAEGPLNILYLTKSSGFEHGAIKRSGGELAHSEKIIKAIAEGMGATCTVTKDASMINAAKLEEFDVVIFYTSGDLTTPGTDGTPPMAETGVADLIAWVKKGGGFMAFHAGNDSFRLPGDEVSPYIEMVGSEFAGHGKQFRGAVKVVDAEHPAMEGFEDGFAIIEEWYTFKKWNKDALHVLALLDLGRERERQEMYNVPDYPIIWCRGLGEGRVYYNALGHREQVWDHKMVQANLAKAIRWTAGEGALDAEPNFGAVMAEPAAGSEKK